MDDCEQSEKQMRRRSRTVSWDHSVRSDKEVLRLPSLQVPKSPKSPSLRDSSIIEFFGDDDNMSISRGHSVEKVRFSASRAHSDENGEDYSASVNAILHKRLSVKKGKHQKQRRSSSPASSMIPDDASILSDRRRSSAFTTSSGDTAINIEDSGNSQEQIFENIRLHKEVLGSVRQQPWSIRRKMKLVQQAKEYVKRHEGQLQERLAMSKSTRDIFARFHIVVVKQWQHSKREMANVISQIIPWELTIKEIESQFGTVVASYFTFLRWLFWVNFVISVLLAAFVVMPEILTTNNADTGERKTLLPEEKDTSMELMTLLNFEGVLQHSPMFYGYYSNQPSSNTGYRLPTAYFITGLVVYIYSFVATLRKMAANSRLSKLSEKDDECIFTWKMFTGWDYMIGNEETAHNRISSIILGFKEALLEEAERMKDKQNWKVVALRIFANLNMIWMLGSSVYAVIFVVARSTEPEAESTLWRKYEITVVMTLIGTFFPIAFEGLGVLESYHPRTTLRVQLARIMALNLLNLYTLTFALFVKINDMTKELLVLKPNISTTTMGPTTTTMTGFPNITTTITTIMTTAALMSSTMTTTTTFLPITDLNDQQQNCHREIIECPTTVQFDPTTLTLATQQPRSTLMESAPAETTVTIPNLTNVTLPSDIITETSPKNKTNTTTFVDTTVTTDHEKFVTTPAEYATDRLTTTDFIDIYQNENNTSEDNENQIFDPLRDKKLANWSTLSSQENESNVTETTFKNVDSIHITANVVYYDTSSESTEDTEDKLNNTDYTNYDHLDNFINQSAVEFKSNEIPTTTVSSIDEFEVDFTATESINNKISEPITNLDNEPILKITTQSITPMSNESILPNQQTDETISSRMRIKRMQENATHCYRFVCSKRLARSTVTDLPQNSQEFSEKSSMPYATTIDHDDAPREDLSLHATSLDLPTRRRLRKLCWETMFGQELVKLTVMDLVSTIISTIFVDFARAVFVRYMNRCWCWNLEKRFPQYGDFKIAENILHLVNNQGMVWMGMFFSPGLPIINVVKLMIMMYVRSWAVLTCNVPHDVVFRASRSNNFYLGLLLTMLFLCVLPVGYAIVWIEPSWHCGPFSQYKKIYHIFTNSIKKTVPNPMVHRVLDYIASPGIVIPLLLLLILIIYYLASLTSSLREANNDLKTQLRRERTEERRKMFQLVNRKRGDDDDYSCMDTTLSKWRQIMPEHKLPTEHPNFTIAFAEKIHAENDVLDKVREKLVHMETDDQKPEKKRQDRGVHHHHHHQNIHHPHQNVHHHRRLSRSEEPRETTALRKWKKSKAFVSRRQSTESDSSDQSREGLPEIRVIKTTVASSGGPPAGYPPKVMTSLPSVMAVGPDHIETTAGGGVADGGGEQPVKQRARLKLAQILYKEARRRRQKYVEELQNQQE